MMSAVQGSPGAVVAMTGGGNGSGGGCTFGACEKKHCYDGQASLLRHAGLAAANACRLG